MFFDKKSLAEFLAMRDLKEENNVVRPIKYMVKKTCSAVPGYCYQDCRECLFSQANPDVKVVDENCPTVSDTDTNKMFKGCIKLEYINLKNVKETRKIEKINDAFLNTPEN